MLGCTPKYINQPIELVTLWVHEARRVFKDRMINEKDRVWFEAELHQIVPKYFTHGVAATATAMQWLDLPGIDLVFYGDYIISGADPKFYEHLKDMDKLSSIINEYLEDYNVQSNAPMPLILFVDAMEHVSRICRIIRQVSALLF